MHDVRRDRSDRYVALFDGMPEAVAFHELVCDDAGKPVNYRTLEVNAQHERRTGLSASDVVGHLATETYGCGSAPCLKEFATVGLGGPAIEFEAPFPHLGRHFRIKVVPTGPKTFATVFSEVTSTQAQSDRKFALVFDLTPDPVTVSDSQGRLLFANQAFCRVIGRPREDLVGRIPSELGMWDQPEARTRLMELLHREGHFENFEMVAVAKDGTRLVMEMSGAMAELDGAPIMLMAARDISLRRLAELEAQRAREELLQYFRLSLDLFCIATADSVLVRVNPAWEHVLGYSTTELEGTQYFDYVHPEDVGATREAAQRLRAGETVIDFQNRVRHKDGSWRWVEWRSAPEASGRIFAAGRDVTRRHRDEIALRAAERATARSREQFLRVSELAHIGHFEVELDSGQITWTPELFRICGLEPSTFTPTLGEGRQRIHPEDAARFGDCVDGVIRSRIPARVEYRIARPNGEYRHCISIINADVDAEGKLRLLGSTQDVTETRRAEEEQRKLEKQVMQSQKLESLGVLAGGIAHDFNNLLTSILGNADLALSELSPMNPACAYLEDIEKVSRRAADLCRQMLAYSGKGRFVIQPLSLNEVVREMGYLLGVSISKKVVIKYNFCANLPSVMADATQIRQVVMNLITNASEAIAEVSGVVTLTTGVMDCDDSYMKGVVGDSECHPPGQYVYFEVSDTGCGMSQETISKIFDPFYTTKFTGRGLGLAAVLGIVRGHRGALRVYSEPGRGTTFKVLLPPHDELAPASGDPEREPKPWQAEGLVLLADDEESIRSMGRHLLERAGFEVLTAADGQAAVELFVQVQDRVCLVILDMTMPHLDGEACFRELRRIKPTVKVVMTSGYNEQEVINRFVGKGLAGFVQKPYKSSDLLPVLRKVLET